MEDKISLKKVVSAIKNGEDFIKLVKIKRYIPIEEKSFILRKYLVHYDVITTNCTDSVMIATELEILMKFDVLLKYTNIECEDEDKTFENYDILCMSGFFDVVKKGCKIDFMRMRDMIKNGGALSDLSVVTAILRAANGEEVKEAAKDIINILGSKDTVKEINKILAFNNPMLAKEIKK